MATYGNVGGFKESEESWTRCTERLEQYFAANEINEEKKQRAVMFCVTDSLEHMVKTTSLFMSRMPVISHMHYITSPYHREDL